MSSSGSSSNRPYAFNPVDEAELATRSDNRCSICRVEMFRGGIRGKKTGQAAHCIGASESTAIAVLNSAPVLGIVSRIGPDPDVALGVRNARVNGMWLCPTCHWELSKEEIVLCPPLKILRAIRDDFDPRVITMQEFLQKVYTKDFPKLRFLYHFVRNIPEVGSLVMFPGNLVTLYREKFCLHVANPNPKTMKMEDHFFELTDSTAPHIWRFPCLQPENVMAVLLHMTNPTPQNADTLLGKEPPEMVLTLNDEFLTLICAIKGAIFSRRALQKIDTHQGINKVILESNDGADGTSETDETSELGEVTDGYFYGVEHDVLDSKIVGGKYALGNITDNEHVLGDIINVPGDRLNDERIEEWLTHVRKSAPQPGASHVHQATHVHVPGDAQGILNTVLNVPGGAVLNVPGGAVLNVPGDVQYILGDCISILEERLRSVCS
ncbi:hypothetical protein GGX14DRAFT_556837 [Mycena pura]|uniref:Uncharacterized protein n=1 Tax=Mycena pura TaxID=153505 RepID=A0AAD6YQF5_9AGAR|nr:hypothetical protein GGX14DRAFT_556837 [Mycena pura]